MSTITITIHKYDSTEKETQTVDKTATYENMIGETPFIVLTNDGTVMDNLKSTDTVLEGDIYKYKYKNSQTSNVDNLPTLTVEESDLTDGTLPIESQIQNTNYYIDNQGVLRTIESSNKIKKVLLTEIPSDNDVESDIMKGLSDILKKIESVLPPYMKIIYQENEYIISKENPYIII